MFDVSSDGKSKSVVMQALRTFLLSQGNDCMNFKGLTANYILLDTVVASQHGCITLTGVLRYKKPWIDSLP